MAANSLGGVGSGIDTNALITGLVSADSGRISALKNKQTSTNSAISTFLNGGMAKPGLFKLAL